MTYIWCYVILHQKESKLAIRELNKRRFPRLDLDLPVRYKIRGYSDFGSSVTKDISIGGLRFITDRYIKPLTDIMLEIDILSRTISSIAKVKWSQSLPHSNRYQIGLEFIELARENKDYLSDFVNFKQSFK